MIRISDIAKKCELSNATVSKSLNGSSEIPQATVLRVKAAAKELNYIPNANARSLKSKRSFSIGVLFVDKSQSGLRHEYFSSMLNAVKEEAERRGYDITFISNMVGGRRMSYVEHARSRSIDGIVIASVDFLDPQVIELVGSGIPTVTVDYVYNGATAILSDNDVGTEALVNYAFSLGHRKIAIIHGENTDVTAKRMAGFNRECAQLGISIPSNFIKSGIYHEPEVVERSLNELLALDDKPTCVLLPDDISAITVLSNIQNRVDNPLKDLSIAGYDGIALSRMYKPILTTYVQDSEMIGTLATSKLIERIEHPATFVPEQVTVKGHLQQGGTIKALSAK